MVQCPARSASPQRADGPPATIREEDPWPQTQQAEATVAHLLRRLRALWTSQDRSPAVESKAHLGPICSSSSSAIASLQSSTTDKSTCSKLTCDTASTRSGNRPSPSLGAVVHLWGFCPTRVRFSALSKRVLPSLSCPTSSHQERGTALGAGTYLRISLQNSRAVRGQPLFSRNIRCLKRARKKALRGEREQVLEARFGEKHLVPPTVSPSSSSLSLSTAVQQGGPGDPARCCTGCHRPATFPCFFAF